MTLQTPFDQFAATALRFGIEEAYLSVDGDMACVTGWSAERGIRLYSQSTAKLEEVRSRLQSTALKVFDGIWSDHPITFAEHQDSSDIFVAAVSYQSGNPIPGIWVDAYPDEPNPIQVLEALYKEFRETGEMPEVTIEEFLRNSNPNVVVLSESKLRSFITAKNPPCD